MYISWLWHTECALLHFVTPNVKLSLLLFCSCPGSSTPDLGQSGGLVGKWVPLFNFDTKSDFWHLRPFRHLIGVMSGQKTKRQKPKWEFIIVMTTRQKEEDKTDNKRKTKDIKANAKKRVKYFDVRAVSHSCDVFFFVFYFWLTNLFHPLVCTTIHLHILNLEVLVSLLRCRELDHQKLCVV